MYFTKVYLFRASERKHLMSRNISDIICEDRNQYDNMALKRPKEISKLFYVIENIL